ncbi:MAG: hypothetical protein AAFQ98_13730, partial [Bacteroidota bacterium]
KLLYGKPKVQQVLTWSTLLFELLFPLFLFTPYPYAWVFLAEGVLLHGSIALLMGLNSFFWAFIATYPALWVCGLQLQSFLGY